MWCHKGNLIFDNLCLSKIHCREEFLFSCVSHSIKASNVSNSCDIKGFVYQIDQELANFFYKGPDNTYFRLCRPYGHWCNHSTLPSYSESSTDNKTMNMNVFQFRLYLWTLKFEFHIIFMVTKYHSVFSKPLTNIEPFLAHSNTKTRSGLDLDCWLYFANPW